MAKKGNLKPMSERSPEEVRRISAEAGKKSGAARRRKREFQKCCEYVMGLKPRASKKQLREWERDGFDFSEGDPPTLGEQIALRLAMRTLKNDDDNALRLFMSYGHNPTMAEKLEGEKIEAIRSGKARVDVSVSREDDAVLESIRAMMGAGDEGIAPTGGAVTGEADANYGVPAGGAVTGEADAIHGDPTGGTEPHGRGGG